MDKQTQDGFLNIVKGLGTQKDGRTNNSFARGLRITQQVASDMYTFNWLAAKVADIPVDDMARKWRTLLIPDADVKKEVQDSLSDFEVKEKFAQASKWARVFGGAAIIAIIENQDLAEPFDISTMKKDSLKNFIVLDMYNLTAGEVCRDILSKNFGCPEFYTVARGGQQVHHTRVLKFFGRVPTIYELELHNYWGQSIYTTMWEPISNSQVTSNAISSMVVEANIDTYMIDGLNNLVAEGKDDLVASRLKIVHEMKSIINGVVLDKNDGYEKKATTFATLPEIDDRSLQKVAGASNIPVTRLLGVSPSGLNATGESDLLNYYDGIQANQESARHQIDWLDSVIYRNLGMQEIYDYKFLPLKQMTEIEQAGVDFQDAQRDQIYLDNEVITNSDAMSQLAEKGTYVSIDAQRVEEEKENNELDFEEEKYKE